ncbi:hypothetical protein CXB51_021849 [Gossypium anomalum]|uniref:Uncharacterized protein n=1 Tax=Gossypium anomalum TaxID=47600 RepID=A0A8J6CZ05_9ROSI|nr:hypothetical protein CXB51_021849 [Gossypium anomalum]
MNGLYLGIDATHYCDLYVRPLVELKVMAPPPINTMEQLLAVQNASDRFATLLVFTALVLALVPNIYKVFTSEECEHEKIDEETQRMVAQHPNSSCGT